MLLCSACVAGPGDTIIDVVFDPCAASVVLSPDAPDDQRAAVDDALRLWNEAAGLALARAPDGDPGIEVHFEESAPAFFGVYDDEVGVIWINSTLDHEARTIVLAHELGHAFGLFHVPAADGASLMSPGNTTVPPTAADVQRLRALWDACQAPSSRY